MTRCLVSWFSAGVSSAVATKLAIDAGDLRHVVYQHIDDQHPDTLRFVRDCEAWFGIPVEIIQSEFKTVEAACRSQRYLVGVSGSECTRRLKRMLRQRWEYEHDAFSQFDYVWGLDADETDRAANLRAAMPYNRHVFPLVQAGLRKAEAHGILARAGIRRPAMYDIGYPNNNCIGCLKGGMGYWNKIRVDFPEVFAARARLERDIGASCINGVYLDELDQTAGRDVGPIVAECGAACEIASAGYAQRMERKGKT